MNRFTKQSMLLFVLLISAISAIYSNNNGKDPQKWATYLECVNKCNIKLDKPLTYENDECIRNCEQYL